MEWSAIGCGGRVGCGQPDPDGAGSGAAGLVMRGMTAVASSSGCAWRR
jgi:hypothetical protein